jgi:FAD/FMN-containing dehydrogenase
MHSLPYLTLDRDVRQLPLADVAALAAQVRGGVLTAADAGYDEARKVWNATVDRRPALIVRCLGESDVQAAVRFAAARRMLLSVRGGGHHIAGNAVAEGGLMVDLSAMRTVAVDPARRTARVGAGALLADVDRATQAHGLAVPLGINSTTGVAGLTLGGGFGWLTRRLGMTVDNLLGVTVVTADGAVRAVSASSEPELFWALRGGGGNFGVATSFEFNLHPVGPELYAGLVVYPFSQARQVLRAWRDFNAGAPDELSVWAVLRKAPPLPFLPASAHGTDVVVFALVHSGDVEAGTARCRARARFRRADREPPRTDAVRGLSDRVRPAADAGRPQLLEVEQLQRARRRRDRRRHRRSRRSRRDPSARSSSPSSGGAMARVAPDATAFVGRDAHYIMNVHGRWSDPRDDDKVRAWARRSFEEAAKHATGSGYVNFLTEDEGERVAASYGTNHARLQALKKRYDPGNQFRMNLNIVPANGAVGRGSS